MNPILLSTKTRTRGQRTTVATWQDQLRITFNGTNRLLWIRISLWILELPLLELLPINNYPPPLLLIPFIPRFMLLIADLLYLSNLFLMKNRQCRKFSILISLLQSRVLLTAVTISLLTSIRLDPSLLRSPNTITTTLSDSALFRCQYLIY